MAYLGKSPNGSGVRSKFVYTASGSETSLSGADDNGNTLKFSDGEYVDVYLNGVLLVHGSDYGTGTANTISSLNALTASDVVEILVYDIFTMAKVNSEVIRSRFYKTASGSETSISGNDDSGAAITFAANAEIEVKVNGVSLVQGTDYNTNSANTVGGLSALSAGQVVEIIVYSKFTLGDTVSKADGGTFAGNIGISGDLTVDTTTLKVDSSNNRVGIGTASPAVLIHGTASAPELRITSSSDSNTPAARMYYTAGSGWNFRLGDAANNEDVKISTHGVSYFNAGNVGIGTSSPDHNLTLQANTNPIFEMVQVAGGPYKHQIAVGGNDLQLRASSGALIMYTGNADGASSTERMRLDSSGSLLVGKTAADSIPTDGIEIDGPNGRVLITRDGGEPLILNRKTSDGLIVALRKDGATVGSIQTKDSRLFISGSQGSTPAGIYFGGGGDVLPASTTNAVDNSISLGGTGHRWKNLYLSGGAYIGGTGSANYLDDYEEGTWTPTFTGAGSNPSITYTVQVGFYTKIGNIVYATCDMRWNGWTGGSGHLRINTLPFATNGAGSGQYQNDVNINYFFGASPSVRGGYFESDTTYYYARLSSDNSSLLQANQVGTSGHFMGTVVYRTNA